MKTQWKGDEPWKKREPGSRLSNKQKAQLNRSKKERGSMEELSVQQVRVIFEKSKLWRMDHHHSFIVTLKNPLSKKEILERMKGAFPKLDLIEEGI